MRIMLCCAAGMSTSLLVEKMLAAAKEEGKDYQIWAVDQTSVGNEIGKFDVLLLGPQVRHTLKKIQKIVGTDVPVEVIPAMDYGRCNGKAVVEFAENVYKNAK